MVRVDFVVGVSMRHNLMRGLVLRSLVVGCLVGGLLVRMRIGNCVFGVLVLTILGNWFEVEVSVGNISMEGFVVEFMVLASAVVTVDGRGLVVMWVVITAVDGHIVVVLGVGGQHSVVEGSLMAFLVTLLGVDRPGVHLRAFMVGVLSIVVIVVLVMVVIMVHVVVVVVRNFVVGIVVGSLEVLVIVMIVLFVVVVVVVGVMEVVSMVRMGHIVLLAVQRKCLELDIMVFDSVFGLRLDLVEELVVRVLNIVHDCLATMVVNVVAVDITSVVVVLVGVVTVVLTLQVVVVVMVASPVGGAGVVVASVLTLEVVCTMVVNRGLLVVISVVVRRHMVIAVIHDPLMGGSVGLKDRSGMLVVVPTVLSKAILVVDNLVTVVEGSMLVSPEELFVGRNLVAHSVDHVNDGLMGLDAMGVVGDFVMGDLVVVHESGLEVGVSMFERGLVEVTKVGRTMHKHVLVGSVGLWVMSLSLEVLLLVILGHTVHMASKHLIVILGSCRLVRFTVVHGVLVSLCRVDGLSVGRRHLVMRSGLVYMLRGVDWDCKRFGPMVRVDVGSSFLSATDHVFKVVLLVESRSGMRIRMLLVGVGVALVGVVLLLVVSTVWVIVGVEVAVLLAVSLVGMLKMRVVLLGKHIVMLVSLLSLLPLGWSVFVGGLGADGFDHRWGAVFTRVKLSWDFGLHLEDKVTIADVGLGGAEGGRVGVEGGVVALVPPV